MVPAPETLTIAPAFTALAAETTALVTDLTSRMAPQPQHVGTIGAMGPMLKSVPSLAHTNPRETSVADVSGGTHLHNSHLFITSGSPICGGCWMMDVGDGVVVVIEPTPIHSIAYIHHPVTPTPCYLHCFYNRQCCNIIKIPIIIIYFQGRLLLSYSMSKPILLLSSQLSNISSSVWLVIPYFLGQF
jgi:hypothetical protein